MNFKLTGDSKREYIYKYMSKNTTYMIQLKSGVDFILKGSLERDKIKYMNKNTTYKIQFEYLILIDGEM